MSNGYIKYRLNDKPNENYLRGDRGKHFGREKGLLSRLANLIMSSDDMYSGVVVKCTNTKSAHISVE
ncbi:hypothetical protein BLOT_012637 [Blomia tropicalis]|nr:hypothetical protein BLOT_012637 [Blomia tropicalis]